MRCPQYFPCVARSIAFGCWTDGGEEPDAICRFDLDEGEGTKRDFFLASPLAFAACSECKVLEPHFGLLCEFAVSPWRATSSRSTGLFLSLLLAGSLLLVVPVLLRLHVVQDIEMFTLTALMAALVEQKCGKTLDCFGVRADERSLVRANTAAGGPVNAASHLFTGKGKAVFDTRRLGGGSAGRYGLLAALLLTPAFLLSSSSAEDFDRLSMSQNLSSTLGFIDARMEALYLLWRGGLKTRSHGPRQFPATW